MGFLLSYSQKEFQQPALFSLTLSKTMLVSQSFYGALMMGTPLEVINPYPTKGGKAHPYIQPWHQNTRYITTFIREDRSRKPWKVIQVPAWFNVPLIWSRTNLVKRFRKPTTKYTSFKVSPIEHLQQRANKTVKGTRCLCNILKQRNLSTHRSYLYFFSCLLYYSPILPLNIFH